jgi:hypothetical protein
MSNLAKIKDMDSEGARKKEKVAPKFGTFKNMRGRPLLSLRWILTDDWMAPVTWK